MCIQVEPIDGIEQHNYFFKNYLKRKPQDAITELIEFCDKVDPNAPEHYDMIKIGPKIALLIPGKYNNIYPGDYLLCWNGKAPTHTDICDALIKFVNEHKESERLTVYNQWIELLQDVYENGTLNSDHYTNEREKFALHLIFWITLQEDINKPDKLGRIRPLCRYVEALATTQSGFQHNYEEVKQRIYDNDPEMLDEWNIPNRPTFYKWRAF